MEPREENSPPAPEHLCPRCREAVEGEVKGEWCLPCLVQQLWSSEIARSFSR